MTTDWNVSEGTVENAGERMVVNCWTNVLEQVQGNGVHCRRGGRGCPGEKQGIYPGNRRKAEGKHTGKGHDGNVWQFSFDYNFPPLKKETKL